MKYKTLQEDGTSYEVMKRKREMKNSYTVKVQEKDK